MPSSEDETDPVYPVVRSSEMSDRGWIVSVRIDGHGRNFTFFPTPERHARLREFGVDQVLLSGESTINCTIMFDPDAVRVTDADRVIALAGEVLSIVSTWLAWPGPAMPLGPLSITWCEPTE
jgi:hypothetical protein